MKRYCDEHPEEWKDLVYMDVEMPGYEVSSYGRIRNKKTGKIYKESVAGRSGGYAVARIRDPYGNKTSSGSRVKSLSIYIHRAKAEAFIPNVNNLPFVNHIDGNKRNHDLYNLEWVTQSENQIHALTHGLSSCYGDTHHWAKLTKDQIEEIKTLKGTGSTAKIAKLYDVNAETVRRIWIGKQRSKNIQ